MNTFKSSHFRSINVMRPWPSSGRLFAALIGLLWSGALALRAADYYAAPYNENQANPYTTWATAGTNIIDVVNTAMTNAGTRMVWVSNGVYILTNQIVITNALTLRSIEGHGPDDTIINGGFAPGNLITNRCLLMNNASVFVHGLTFSNGAYVGTTADGGGGGVKMVSGILSNCTVRNNTYFSILNWSVAGGGIYMQSGTAVACRVTDNLVTNPIGTSPGGAWGGGIGAVTNSTIIDCLISNNVLQGIAPNGYEVEYHSGAGVSLSGTSTISSSMICNNRSILAYGGGIRIYGNASIMNACTVTLNQAVGYGGGVEMRAGTVTNCVISFNYSTQFGSGIALYNDTASNSNRVFNSTIVSNTGSALVYDCRISGLNLVDNCVITDNTGSGVDIIRTGNNNFLLNSKICRNGGGINVSSWSVYNYGGNVKIRNCLIANNNSYGLWIQNDSTSTAVSCSTIVSNKAGSLGSGIRFETTNIIQAISVSSCVIYSNGASGVDDVYDKYAPTNYGRLQYSCIGSNRGFNGAGIIVTNPLFKNFAEGNYRLSGNSPCINTGSNETWMEGAVDLDRHRRIDRFSGIVDMGVYEYIHKGTMFSVY